MSIHFTCLFSIPDILEDQLQAVQDADCFITMLHDYSGMGAAMRHVMTSALVNPQVYLDMQSSSHSSSNS